MQKKNERKVNSRRRSKQATIVELNLSKTTILTMILVMIIIAITAARILTTATGKEDQKLLDGDSVGKVNKVMSTDDTPVEVPVPEGYVASQIEGETTVSGGFVIYEDNYNGKSINWDEIIVKDDGSGTNEVNVDDGKIEETTETIETPETPEVIPTEDGPEDETAMTPENVSDEGEQEEQGESVENYESTVNEENPIVQEEEQVEETKANPEESSTSEESSQEENEVSSQANEGVAIEGERGATTDPTEPETPATPTAEQQTKKNVFELQKSVNQYVWVPVPDISRICGVDANGKLWGKLYNFNNSGSTPLNWTETEGKIGIKNKTSYREPDVTVYATDYDRDRYLKNYMYGETRQELLSEEMEQEFYETMKSIERYGGYYIGRYETGGLNSKAVVQKMQDGNGVTNKQTWYTMYKKCNELAGSNENVKTSMIWGSLWDETLKWLVESGATTTGKEGVASQPITYSLMTNSTTWGNYYNTTFNYIPLGEEPEATATKAMSTSTRIPTGSAEYTKANNIYDMAGNVYDWTLEAYSTSYRVLRGGYYNNYGSYYPASYRGNGSIPSGSDIVSGCRAALIIR